MRSITIEDIQYKEIKGVPELVVAEGAIDVEDGDSDVDEEKVEEDEAEIELVEDVPSIHMTWVPSAHSPLTGSSVKLPVQFSLLKKYEVIGVEFTQE